jgi:hypothetical protein
VGSARREPRYHAAPGVDLEPVRSTIEWDCPAAGVKIGAKSKEE